MKKVLVYFFAFVFLCFLLPALLTKQDVQVNAEQEEKQEEKTEEIASSEGKNRTIQLLHSKTGEVEEVELEEYLCHVVSAEMPADYEKEALKAQAIVARTYTYYKMQNRKHENADICDASTCCQAWISKEDRLAKWDEGIRESNWKKIEECVQETKGKIVTYEQQPINAFFHANSGGRTELPVNVWGGSELPYLQVVETAGEEGYRQYASELELTQQELFEKLKGKYPNIQINFEDSNAIQILEYTDSDRVKTVQFGNCKVSGVEVRTLLGLKSTNFEITKQENKIKFTVKGYGHGVGMSQTGANTMAKEGKTAEEIIHHFYRDVEIEKID